MVAAQPCVVARVPVGAALAKDDLGGEHALLWGVIRMGTRGGGVGGRDVPPDFFAPRRLPGPSREEFTEPWALWEAGRTVMGVREGREGVKVVDWEVEQGDGRVEERSEPRMRRIRGSSIVGCEVWGGRRFSPC